MKIARRTAHLLVALAGVALAGLAALGCGSSTDESARGPSMLTVNSAQAPTSIDPSAVVDPTSWGFTQNLYVRLTQFATKPGPDGTLQTDHARAVPYLARSVDVSDDGLRYTFKLRKASFADGSPIDAAAVKFSLERVIEENSVGAFVITDGIPNLFKSMKVVAADTLEMNLSQPNIDLLKGLATAPASIVDPKVVNEHGGVKANTINKWMATHVAGGGGPFILQSYTPGTGAVLQRNPDFFAKPPRAVEIKVNFISAGTTLALRAKSGAADVTLGLEPQLAADLQDANGLRVIATPSDAFRRGVMVNSKPPFDNRQFREALTYAVPYDQILERVQYGFGELIYSPFSFEMGGWDHDLGTPRTFDMDKAENLLAESGVELPVSVEYVVPSDSPADQQIATILQSQWKELGINLKIKRLTKADFNTAQFAHEYQMLGDTNQPGVYTPLYAYYDVQCDGGFNASNVCIPEADAAYKRARVTPDAEEAEALLNKVVELWRDASPLIVFYQEDDIAVLGDQVDNFVASRFWDFRNWG